MIFIDSILDVWGGQKRDENEKKKKTVTVWLHIFFIIEPTNKSEGTHLRKKI